MAHHHAFGAPFDVECRGDQGAGFARQLLPCQKGGTQWAGASMKPFGHRGGVYPAAAGGDDQFQKGGQLDAISGLPVLPEYPQLQQHGDVMRGDVIGRVENQVGAGASSFSKVIESSAFSAVW